MNSDRARWLVLALLPLLAACEEGVSIRTKSVSTFGEANRQTNLAQVVDPDPQYPDAAMATSARQAAQAIDRYAKDAVKKPERTRSTVSTSNSTSGTQ